MENRKLLLILIILATLLTISTACGGDAVETPPPTEVAAVEETAEATATAVPPTAVPEPIIGAAEVDSIELNILETFPVQVQIVARGVLADGCTQIEQIAATRVDSQFDIEITTLRDPELVCTQELVPFSETIPLDVLDLPAGAYTVSVNGIMGSFSLSVDNSVPEEEPTAEPTAVPADSNQALISGRVWHDLCAVGGGDGGETAVPSAGCIASPDGSFQANGLLEENEPGLPEITVSLGAGACPAADLATVITDEDGDYFFDELPAGEYCVSIDPLAAENEALLPGGWTFPDVDTGSETVSLADGEVLTGINFGWDYQFLPAPDVDLANCVNSIEFVQDLTVPDDTVFAPGTEFEKGWRLRNNGTCPWTTDYSVVFVGGDEMGETQELPFSETIVAGQTVDIILPLVAPDAAGTYRSNWQISNADGVPFGVGGFASEAFWVQIVVGTPEPTPEPNSAAIGGVVWNDFCRLNSDGEPGIGCAETEAGSGFYRADGSLNFSEARLVDVTVTLAAGTCPADGFLEAGTVLQTTTTDTDGLYRFTDLEEGVYCVAIAAFSDDNVNILIPGDWTWPGQGVGLQTVNLAAGAEALAIDFGWDYQD